MTLGIGIKTTGGTIMVYDMFSPDPRFRGNASDPKDKLTISSYGDKMQTGAIIGMAGLFDEQSKGPRMDFLEKAFRDKDFVKSIQEGNLDDYQQLTDISKGLKPNLPALRVLKGLVESAKETGNQFMIGTFDGRLFEVNGEDGMKESNVVVNGSGADLVGDYVKSRYRDGMSYEEGMQLAKDAMNIALTHRPDKEHRVTYQGYSMRIIREDSIEEIVDPLAKEVDFNRQWTIGAEREGGAYTRKIKINKTENFNEDKEVKETSQFDIPKIRKELTDESSETKSEIKDMGTQGGTDGLG